ncbi:MAG: hypothetical protein Q8R24_02890 [Legionellaceae bacterium]|nr:hypothetical protein [Legionellaceae bacterium]
MFWHKKQSKSELSIACSLNENRYSIAVVEQNKRVLFSQSRMLTDDSDHVVIKSLADDVDRLNLIAHDCKLILLPGQYQLILMDAPNVPEADMAKALRWHLKGFSDYDLDDVLIDSCIVPANHNNDKHKIFAAITPLLALNKKRALLELAFLNVTTVTVAEMALKNVLSLMRLIQIIPDNEPVIVISICNDVRKLHIIYQDIFYLIRALLPAQTKDADDPVELANMHFEIERSIDYCVNELNIPEPKRLLFTPGFHHVINFLKPIGEKLDLIVETIDLNQYLTIEPSLSLEQQHEVFYSITGALTLNQEESFL